MKRLLTVGRVTTAILIVSTLTTNMAALTMPLVARQVLTRGSQNPQSSTVIVLILIVVAAAILEGLLKYSRTMILAQADRTFMTRRLHWLLDRVARAHSLKFRSAAAASLDYASALLQVKGIANGELSLIWAELAFVPLILLFLFTISMPSAIAVVLFLAVLVLRTYASAKDYSQVAENSRAAIEHRFEMLFSILEKMHLVKSLAVEHQMTRVYEQAHGAAMSHNLDLANAATRMTHTGSIAGMVLNLVLLLTCALASMRGDLNVSVVISVILLASRLMDPIQRAVFIYVQGRDRRAAFDKIVELDERTRLDEGSLPDGTFDALEELRADRLRLGDSAEPGAPSARQMPISLTLKAGDCIAVSSSSPALARRLMRALAGLDNEHQPDPALEGPSPARVMVNRLPLQDYSSADRNRIVGYVSADNRLFDGTIQDNITRFGEVSIPQAFEVAALFGIDRRLDELPGGIRTIVGDAAGGAIPPGLERQIAIMRAIVHRPRIILFDHAEQGLDRDSYADLVRFFSQVRGQATIVIASEDANLTAIADRIYHLDDQGLSLAEDLVLTQTPYRALVV